MTKEAIDLERNFIYSFDVRNDIGINVGQPNGSVESHIIYWHYTHSLSVRSGVPKLEIFNQQLL